MDCGDGQPVFAHARTTSPRTASDQRYEWSDTYSGNIKALRQILTTSIQSIHIDLLLLQNLSAGLLPRRSASPTKSTSEDIGQKYHLSDGSVFLLSCTRTKSQAANLSKTTPLLLVYIQQVKRVRVYTSWQTFRKGPATPKANSRIMLKYSRTGLHSSASNNIPHKNVAIMADCINYSRNRGRARVYSSGDASDSAHSWLQYTRDGSVVQPATADDVDRLEQYLHTRPDIFTAGPNSRLESYVGEQMEDGPNKIDGETRVNRRPTAIRQEASLPLAGTVLDEVESTNFYPEYAPDRALSRSNDR